MRREEEWYAATDPGEDGVTLECIGGRFDGSRVTVDPTKGILLQREGDTMAAVYVRTGISVMTFSHEEEIPDVPVD